MSLDKCLNFVNLEKKFEKLPERYFVQNGNTQIKNTLETVQCSLRF